MTKIYDYSSVRHFFNAQGICHKDLPNWRLTTQSLVQVNGLPDFCGFLICTNGILAYLETETGRVIGPVHLEWCDSVDKGLLTDLAGQPLKQTASPRRKVVQVEISELLALCKS